jgi:tetratricopeptide (TPR) repeat protein
MNKPTRLRGMRAAAILAAALAGPGIGAAQAQAARAGCGSLQNAYGPFDYRTQRDKLQVVEEHHFTPQVESLIRGQEGYIGGDIDYTLRAFPNHHRALMAVMRWGEKNKSPQPRDLQYPVECYFERALRFKPDDTTARMLYATYLLRNNREAAAIAELDRTVTLAGDNAFTHYNAGLVYLDAKNYEKALKQAHTAYGLGFPRQDLKVKLTAAGKWREAPPAAAGSAASPAGAASAVDAAAAPGSAAVSTTR